MPERRRHIPEWAEQERLADLAWIGENLPVFWTAAQQGYAEYGRGALVVDTTVQPEPDAGNPVYYLAQALLAELAVAGEDERRMVDVYEPAWQFVAMLLKAENRVSSYRVGVPGLGPHD